MKDAGSDFIRVGMLVGPLKCRADEEGPTWINSEWRNLVS